MQRGNSIECLKGASICRIIGFLALALLVLVDPVLAQDSGLPEVSINIGGNEIKMPMDWSIAICDDDYHTEIEIVPLTSLNNRGFKTPVFNPMNNKIPEIEEVFITNYYQDIKWFFPKLKNGHMLVVPLEDGPEPKCAMFVKDYKKIKNVDISDLL